MYAILDGIVDGYYQAIEQIEDRLEDIGDPLFDESLLRDAGTHVPHSA